MRCRQSADAAAGDEDRQSLTVRIRHRHSKIVATSARIF
jgi:hypothetical protein